MSVEDDAEEFKHKYPLLSAVNRAASRKCYHIYAKLLGSFMRVSTVLADLLCLLAFEICNLSI